MFFLAVGLILAESVIKVILEYTINLYTEQKKLTPDGLLPLCEITYKPLLSIDPDMEIS